MVIIIKLSLTRPAFRVCIILHGLHYWPRLNVKKNRLYRHCQHNLDNSNNAWFGLTVITRQKCGYVFRNEVFYDWPDYYCISKKKIKTHLTVFFLKLNTLKIVKHSFEHIPVINKKYSYFSTNIIKLSVILFG